MNILLADAGASKTDWVKLSLNKDRNYSQETYSGSGLSPNLHSSDAIEEELRMVRAALGNSFSEIRYFGAGVGSPTAREKMIMVLSECFDCPDIEVCSDMECALRAVLGRNPGIACIMGTGSNSCHWDGKEIDIKPASLGYILDDRGGGFGFCSTLLSDIYKEFAPVEIREEFYNRYGLTLKDVIEHLYHHPAPNSWVASFMPFIIEHKESQYISHLIDSQLNYFFNREFHCYSDFQLKEEGIGFAGSVAGILATEISRHVARRGWKLTCVVARPMDNILKSEIDDYENEN